MTRIRGFFVCFPHFLAVRDAGGISNAAIRSAESRSHRCANPAGDESQGDNPRLPNTVEQLGPRAKLSKVDSKPTTNRSRRFWTVYRRQP